MVPVQKVHVVHHSKKHVSQLSCLCSQALASAPVIAAALIFAGSFQPWRLLGDETVTFLDFVAEVSMVFGGILLVKSALASKTASCALDHLKLRMGKSDGHSKCASAFQGRYTLHHIEQLVKVGDLPKAEKAVEHLHAESARRGCRGTKGEVWGLNLLLHAYARVGDSLRAARLLEDMIASGAGKNVISYNTVIDAHSKAGDVKGAESWLARLLSSGVSPNVVSYTAVITACARVGDVERAKWWFHSMRDARIEASLKTWTSLICACAKKGLLAEAEQWFSQMLLAQVEPNVNTYATLIDCCAKAGEVRRAEHWFQQMVHAGVKPNIVSYSSVINACAKGGDPIKAEEWLERMLAAGLIRARAAEFSPIDDLPSEVVSYSSVIDAYAKAGDADSAQRVFDRMVVNGVQPSTVTYTSLARPFAQRGNYEQVEHIQKEMLMGGVSLNEYFLNILLTAYNRARPQQIDRAEAAVREACRRRIKLNKYISTSLERCVGGRRFAVLQVELGLPDPKPRWQR